MVWDTEIKLLDKQRTKIEILATPNVALSVCLNVQSVGFRGSHEK